MPFIHDRVLDLGLNILTTEGNRFDLTSQEATSYAQATTTFTLGRKTTITISAPAARTPTGRKVVMGAISGGVVTGSGTVTSWAITDTVNSRLLVAGTLNSSQVLSLGVGTNTFNTNVFEFGIPGVA